MTCSEAPTARSVPISRLPARMRAERALLIVLAQMAKKSSRMAPCGYKQAVGYLAAFPGHGHV